MNAAMNAQANIYRNRGQWCYALYAGNEYDHSDALDVDTEDEARAWVRENFPGAGIVRVGDTNI